MQQFSKINELDAYLNSINCDLPSYLKFDVKRAKEVVWLQSHKDGSFLIERTFVELFNYGKTIDDFVNTTGSVKHTCSKNRLTTYSLLSKESDVQTDVKLSSIVKSQMADLLRLSGVKYKTITPSLAFDSLPSNTGSSFPNFVRPKSKIKSLIVKQVHLFLRNPVMNILNYPISINWRTQISHSLKLKFRQFYPFPVILATLEKTIFGRLFDHFEKHKSTPYCYANTFEDLAPRYLKWQEKRFIYSIDFESFDQLIPNELIETCIDFLARYIVLTDHDRKSLAFIVKYHLSCKIVTRLNNKCTIFQKKRGLMSGSSLTNILGSMINLFMTLYLDKVYKLGIDPKSISIMGDDIIFASDKDISLSTLSTLYMKHFSMKISIDKSEKFAPGEKVFFLGYYFNHEGRYLSEDKVKLQLCISEHFIPEDVLSTNERVWSKFCSILFKCTDGSRFYDYYKARLFRLLKINGPLPLYTDLYGLDGVHNKIRNFNEYKERGWRLC